MKYYELTKQENKILKEVEKGRFMPVKQSGKQKRLYQNFARFTLNKTKNINLRLTERDLQKLKTKAAREGIPYQTLVSSLIHRFTNEQNPLLI